jgi:hypothetical protein
MCVRGFHIGFRTNSLKSQNRPWAHLVGVFDWPVPCAYTGATETERGRDGHGSFLGSSLDITRVVCPTGFHVVLIRPHPCIPFFPCRTTTRPGHTTPLGQRSTENPVPFTRHSSVHASLSLIFTTGQPPPPPPVRPPGPPFFARRATPRRGTRSRDRRRIRRGTGPCPRLHAVRERDETLVPAAWLRDSAAGAIAGCPAPHPTARADSHARGQRPARLHAQWTVDMVLPHARKSTTGTPRRVT